MVRPFIAPSKSGRTLFFPSSGDIQLFVGPASSFSRVQMKVSLLGAGHIVGIAAVQVTVRVSFAGLSSVNVPSASISPRGVSFSASEPSHQTIFVGFRETGRFFDPSFQWGGHSAS